MDMAYIVGRLVKNPTIKEVNDKKVCNITLAVPRTFKNANGEYETDFLPVSIWNGFAESTFEYCKKGDLLGVKGQMQGKNNKISIFAERVTFLSSKSKKDEITVEKNVKK